MNDMAPVIVDFAQEKEAGYRRVFARSPVLSSIAANWDDVYVAYDYFLPGQTPPVCAKQHAIAVFVDLPAAAPAERYIDGQFRSEQVMPGNMVIVPANTWHQSGWSCPGGAVMVALEPEQFTQMACETIDLHQVELLPHFATLDPLIHQLGLALKQTLQTLDQTTNKPNRLYAESISTALTMHLLQHYSIQRPSVPIYLGGLAKRQLQQVVDYIQAHLNQDLSLRELANLVQLSPHYFSQQFKQSTGMSPHQYVIYCRIEQAKVLLRQGKLTIAEVARTVGFVDQSHFHRHFKRLIGTTPKIFLQQ